MTTQGSAKARDRRRWALGALLAVAAAAAIAGPARAQVHACDRPDLPDIPAGYLATYDEMQDGEAGVEFYAEEMEAYLDCRQGELADAGNELEGVRDHWEEAVDGFRDR